MMLQVQYRDYSYDFINSQTLDRLLAEKGVRKFFRLSERRWIDVERDPIRGSGGKYSGQERRQSYNMSPKP